MGLLQVIRHKVGLIQPGAPDNRDQTPENPGPDVMFPSFPLGGFLKGGIPRPPTA